MQSFLDALKARPVIAAVRDPGRVQAAAQSGAGAVFLLGGSIMMLPEMVDEARAQGKRVFAHLDLLDGLGHDVAAVEWCARYAKPDGLISTRAPLLRHARECGMMTIQRLFVMDSSAIAHGIKQLKQSKPDMIEVLPGLMPKAISALCAALPGAAVIAGGMITEPDEVHCALQAGAFGISSSEQRLWSYAREAFNA